MNRPPAWLGLLVGFGIGRRVRLGFALTSVRLGFGLQFLKLMLWIMRRAMSGLVPMGTGWQLAGLQGGGRGRA